MVRGAEEAPSTPPAAADVTADEASSRHLPMIAHPKEVLDPPWLAQRAQDQLKTVDRFEAFHDFRFADRAPESDITFVHRATDDSGKAYKLVHYDHGNGLAVADVDGDGRPDLYFVNQLGGNELWRNQGNGKFDN